MPVGKIAEGTFCCSPPQELERTPQRGAEFLVLYNSHPSLEASNQLPVHYSQTGVRPPVVPSLGGTLLLFLVLLLAPSLTPVSWLLVLLLHLLLVLLILLTLQVCVSSLSTSTTTRVWSCCSS